MSTRSFMPGRAAPQPPRPARRRKPTLAADPPPPPRPGRAARAPPPPAYAGPAADAPAREEPAMRTPSRLAALLALVPVAALAGDAEPGRVLPAGKKPADARLGHVRTLDDKD